ncbi:MAG: endolytic transglycosylase MltG [Anaerolineae bacterium]|nr:endolytic transglycosylase MltG [Anaerolineae bacterium]
MGLSSQVRNVGRFLVLMVAVLAVLLVGSATVLYFRSQYTPSPPPPEGRPGISFESPDDLYFSLLLRWRYRDVIAPVGTDDSPVSFVVEPGETAGGIAARLEEEGLVGDANLFKTYVRFHDLDANLEAGEHILRRTMTMEEVAHELLFAQLRETQITIVPGWRIEEIAEMLASETTINPDEFLLVARTGTFNYAFLGDRPAGSSLEGYLVADTYRINVDADATALIERLLETFDQRVSLEMRRDAAARGMSIHELVTLASIVEREALLDEERPIVASVYLNRLEERLPEADGYLRADPTYQYARGYDPASDRWWAGFGVEDVTRLDDPYNTFLYKGLPPGPICSPSLSSLKAVVYPAETDYLYFYAKQDGSGAHAFAETYEEHLANQALYGGGGE